MFYFLLLRRQEKIGILLYKNVWGFFEVGQAYPGKGLNR